MTEPVQCTMGFDAGVRLLSVVVGALLAGLVGFAVFAMIVPSAAGGAVEGRGSVMSYFACAFGVVSLWLAPTLGSLAVKSGLRRLSAETPAGGPGADRANRVASASQAESAVIGLLVSKTIVVAALLEGGGLLCFVAAWVEGRYWPMVVGGLLTAALAVQYPTRDRARRWVDRQLRQVSPGGAARSMPGREPALSSSDPSRR